MAQEIVGVKIQVGTEGFDNIAQLRKGLKAANEELLKAQTNFGETSKEALAAANKVQQFKDVIQDAGEAASLFDPGKKFQVFANALGAVAGGFSAVQGALGLVGTKSEEVEKTLLKVQSALALSQGLNTIADSAKDFQRLAAVVKTQVVTAFSTLRGAIIATGIGALGIALTLVVANFEKVKKVVLDILPGLGKAADFIGRLVNEVTDFIGITSEAERQVAKTIAANDKALKESERNLELNGDKYDEYTKRKIEANNKFREQQNAFLKDETLTEIQRNEFIKQARDRANREILKADADRNKEQKDANKKRDDEQKTERERLDKEKKDREDQRIEDFKNYVKDLEEQTNAEIELQNFIIENQKKKEQELFEYRVDIAQRSFDITEETYSYYQELNKKQKDDEQKLLDARLSAQLGYANSIGQVFGQLASLFGQGTAASKAAAIAEIAIGTGTGFINALDIAQKGAKATGPAAPFAFPIFYATQIAAVLGAAAKAKNILSAVKGGGGGLPSTSGVPFAAAPIGIQAPQAQLTQLNQQSINQLGSATTRAYVVESDVTNSQERVARLNRAARIG